jgi:hypothetical protein
MPFIRTQPVADCSFMKTTRAAGQTVTLSGSALFREGKSGRLVLAHQLLCEGIYTVAHFLSKYCAEWLTNTSHPAQSRTIPDFPNSPVDALRV